ncbi:MAG: CARDB domain-containing protein [Minisyncoccia bacterium]
MSDTPQSQNPGLLANILAVAGFIILVVVIIWGAYHLLRLTGSGVSSLFGKFGSSNTEIAVIIPSALVQPGTSFPLSWKFTPKETGSYAFLYQCKNGFRFDLTSASGKANAVPCGSAFTVGTSTSLTLTPVSSGSAVDVPVSIIFIPAATSTTVRPQGTGTVRVAAASTATPATTPNTGTATTPRPVQPITKADLSVRILAVGVINPSTGAFESRYPSGPNDIAAIQFDIANNGGTSSGNWYFTVNLPIQGTYAYSSPLQANLTPGSHVVNTLRFKPVQSGGGTISVNVDSTYAVSESNESNNSAAMFIAAPAWTGSYQPYVY